MLSFQPLSPAMPTALPIELMGPLMGSKAEIEVLQRALKNLAIATQRPDIDPGVIDGVVGAPTVTAVIAAQALLSEKLPTWAFLSLQAGLAVGAMTAKAKEAVSIAAVPLTVAANTAALKFAKAPVPGGGGMAPTGFFAPGWYKKPAGIALIVVGVLVAYKLFLAPKAA